MIKVAFLYIGGMHQVFHTAAVAAELSKRDGVEVHCLFAGDQTQSVFRRIADSFDAGPIHFRPMPIRSIWRPILKTLNIDRAHKLLRLHAMRRELAGFDVVVTPERTSAILKNWISPKTRLIHFRHGVGDGQKGFETRVKAFDFVFVSGEKDRQRLYNDGLVAPGKCSVTGSVKLATVHKLHNPERRLFDNDRPTVLYNPHFNRALGSWQKWGPQIVSAFANQTQYNLVIAPHIRMFENAGKSARAEFEALSIPGKIIADAGSIASCDMTYTLASDIFLGDVSSQAYEFISNPRPCIFLNAHGVDWEWDKNYAFWHFGDVLTNVERVLPSIETAQLKHFAIYKNAQVLASTRALGPDWRLAPERAATDILNRLLEQPAAAEAAVQPRIKPAAQLASTIKEDAA